MTTMSEQLSLPRSGMPTRAGWAILVFLIACPSASQPPPTPPPPTSPSDASLPVDGASSAPSDAQIADAPPDANGSSSVVLSFSTQGKATNCSAPPAGAAISQLTLSASQATRPGGTTCAPLSATLLRSGSSLGSSSSACPGAPAALPCPEVGDVVKIQPIEVGAYEVSAIGLSAGIPCWSAVASVGVVQGASTAQAVILAPRVGGGCPASGSGAVVPAR